MQDQMRVIHIYQFGKGERDFSKALTFHNESSDKQKEKKMGAVAKLLILIQEVTKEQQNRGVPRPKLLLTKNK